MFIDFSEALDSTYGGNIEPILLAYGLPKETVTAIPMFYKNTKAIVRLPDGDTYSLDILAGILLGDIFAPYLFIICQDNVLLTSIDLIKENGLTLKRTRSRWYHAETITDADYADYLALLANTHTKAE